MRHRTSSTYMYDVDVTAHIQPLLSGGKLSWVFRCASAARRCLAWSPSNMPIDREDSAWKTSKQAGPTAIMPRCWHEQRLSTVASVSLWTAATITVGNWSSTSTSCICIQVFLASWQPVSAAFPADACSFRSRSRSTHTLRCCTNQVMGRWGAGTRHSRSSHLLGRTCRFFMSHLYLRPNIQSSSL